MGTKDSGAVARSILANVPTWTIFDYINSVKNPKIKQNLKKRVQEYQPRPEVVDKFERIMDKHYLIVFATDWSPECQAYLPCLAKLLMLTKNSSLLVKVVDFYDNRDVAEDMGIREVPAIIVHDKKWREIGRFIHGPQRFATVEEELWVIFEKAVDA